VISHIVYTIGNVLTFVFTDFPTILICRFLVGTAHMTISHLPYMLGKCNKLLKYSIENIIVFLKSNKQIIIIGSSLGSTPSKKGEFPKRVQYKAGS
jgi:hypothetical protein